jgi:hypothetical protein
VVYNPVNVSTFRPGSFKKNHKNYKMEKNKYEKAELLWHTIEDLSRHYHAVESAILAGSKLLIKNGSILIALKPEINIDLNKYLVELNNIIESHWKEFYEL